MNLRAIAKCSPKCTYYCNVRPVTGVCDGHNGSDTDHECEKIGRGHICAATDAFFFLLSRTVGAPVVKLPCPRRRC